MYVLNITDEFDSFTNSTEIIDDENNIILLITKVLLLSIPSNVLLMSLIGLIKWTTPNLLITYNKKDDILHPTHLVRCIITGPSEI